MGSSASRESIRRAFRRIALLLHPDKTRAPSDDVRTRAFLIAQTALATLSDGRARAEYDARRLLREQGRAARAPRRARAGGWAGGWTAPAAAADRASFAELFEAEFGRGAYRYAYRDAEGGGRDESGDEPEAPLSSSEVADLLAKFGA